VNVLEIKRERGQRIRAARKAIKMSQQELAKGSGIALSSIRKYESGEREPRGSGLSSIAKVLNVDEYYLHTGITFSELIKANSQFIAESTKTLEAFLSLHGLSMDTFPNIWLDYVDLLKKNGLTHEQLIAFIVFFYFESSRDFRNANANLCAMLLKHDGSRGAPSTSWYKLDNEEG